MAIVSYFSKNDIHGDDSYFLHQDNNYIFAGVADGISSNKLGKVCSFLVLDKINYNVVNKQFSENLRSEIEIAKDLKIILKSLVEFSIHETVEDYKNNVIPSHFKSIIKNNKIPSKSTLLVALIDLVNMYLYTYCLGDSECWILRNGKIYNQCGNTVGTKVIENYVDLSIGAIGKPDLSSRLIYPNDVIIINTDGAKVNYTSKFGIPFTPFVKLINQDILNSPKNWIDFLQSNNLLYDDATIIVIQI